jgi:pimeloyl-ACP methyl ester carboxylesterase
MTPLRWPALGLAGWRQQGGSTAVLALHGWLDNANSFAPLAPFLPGLDLVALDLPGHGLSGHRPPGVRYHFDDNIFDVLSAADHLGWTRFHLIGHSMGGAVATLVAAACPDRVASIVNIEGLGPIAAPPDESAGVLQKAVRGSRDRARRQHPDRASAVAARARHSDLDTASAALLAERGLKACEDGWAWGHDLRLTWPSSQRYTETQVLAIIAAVRCPVLTVYSNPPSGLIPQRVLQRRLAAVHQRTDFAAPGGHHLHMRHAKEIGARITEFLDDHTIPAESDSPRRTTDLRA